MTRHFKHTLAAGGVVVLDGGTGSELRRRGIALSAAAWSGLAPLADAETLTRIHADYIDAGADVITCSTFGTARFVLDAAGAGDAFARINDAAVDAAFRARDAAGRDVAVAGSISCLPPGFDTAAYPAAEDEYAAYLELAGLFARRGVDLLVLEMLQEPVHAALACRAARDAGLPFWLGISVRRDARGDLVGFDSGLGLDDWLAALLDFGPAAVNVMHTPPADTGPALEALRARWRGIAGAYPVVGEDAPDSPGWLPRCPPDALAALARGWIDAGARIVGGCCGTTPAHIRSLAALRAGMPPVNRATAAPDCRDR